jgi:hypothetical protein
MSIRDLQAQWDDAVALASQARQSDPEGLGVAAGLPVRSGVRAAVQLECGWGGCKT